MMTVTLQRRGRAVRVNLINGGRVGDFRSEDRAMAFTKRVLGDFQVQQEFNLRLTAPACADKGGRR